MTWRIEDFIEKFISFGESQFEGSWEAYMKIRVCMEVGKHLKVGTTLRKGKRVGHHVGFKYEKLPSFCFVCGVIGHADRFCPLTYECENTVLEKSYGWDSK
ncbi:unnamed protein product [Cuscuta epithymum]|uniref:Zinc knuckle CX2CX4HX4C domain-containing protein n=1 Tax=Cuscuta epithymum TaxID=186058 RepID=A0AAV0EAL4_9ASTE|nr:unnamed protein product [Cuscuta epithymum]